MLLGLDYATPLSAAGLQAAVDRGYSFVLRYGPPSIYKASFTECDAIRAAGLAFGHIFQVQADRALRGAEQGAADGRQLDAWATDCGAPLTNRLIYVAADFDATLAQLRGPIAEYARAFDLACRRPTMPYGPYTTMEVLCGELGIAPYGWQCAGYSGSGSGSGGSFRCNDGSVRRLSKYAALFQDVGYVLDGRADRNVVLREPIDWAWPQSAAPAPSPKEEDLTMKCVFTPDQTGGVGWRALEIDGRRYREGYSSREDLDADLAAGLVDGEVTLHGAAAQRFLDRYPSIVPPAGPVLVRPKTGSTWATDVAGLGPAELATFVLYPSGIIVQVRDDHQADVDRFLGLRDLGEVDDVFLFNGALMPWGSKTVELGEVELEGVKVGLTDQALAQVAEAVNDEAHARSAE